MTISSNAWFRIEKFQNFERRTRDERNTSRWAESPLLIRIHCWQKTRMEMENTHVHTYFRSNTDQLFWASLRHRGCVAQDEHLCILASVLDMTETYQRNVD